MIEAQIKKNIAIHSSTQIMTNIATWIASHIATTYISTHICIVFHAKIK